MASSSRSSTADEGANSLLVGSSTRTDSYDARSRRESRPRLALVGVEPTVQPSRQAQERIGYGFDEVQDVDERAACNDEPRHGCAEDVDGEEEEEVEKARRRDCRLTVVARRCCRCTRTRR